MNKNREKSKKIDCDFSKRDTPLFPKTQIFGAANYIFEKLVGAGHSAYFAGGCVRDSILKLPINDIDIATSATPEEVQKLFKRSKAVGASFGVVIVEVNSIPFEVATFRTDSSYSDGRHPDKVEYSNDPKIDIQRRDFTINGLFYNAQTDEVLDVVGGIEDLEAGKIRAIGNPEERFAEDYLRMLRAVRFAARFGFEIENETLFAIRENAHKIKDLAAERVNIELTKIWTGPNPHYALDLLRATGLLDEVLPEVAALEGVEQPKKYHPEGDVYNHTYFALKAMWEDLGSEVPPTLAWGVLLHDIGKPRTAKINNKGRVCFNGHDFVGAKMAEKLCDRLKFSNDDRDLIITLIRNHMKFLVVHNMKVVTLKKFLRVEGFDQLLMLHKYDSLSGVGDLSNYEYIQQKLAAFEAGNLQDGLRPKILLNGEDLKDLGYEPGPLFGKFIHALEDKQLNEEIKTKDAAVSFAIQYLGKGKK